jgi:lipoprotein-anchoring transpeptidase ErfK/SrfK
MMNVKTIAGMLLCAALALTAAAPTQAAYVYNAEKSTWEDAATVTVGRNARTSPIKREVVAYETKYKPGTVIVETAERRLYFVLPDGEAIRYGIGVGRDGFRWSGVHHITRKAEWPGWTPPPQMRKRVPGLPAFMPGGPNNPLGARAMYIGSTLYRLHGTSEPWTIGQAVSSGCIRLTNEDVIDLYNHVAVGATVVVHNQ